MSDISAVKALVFDVFGTVVDWRTSLIADFTKWSETRGIKADWTALVDGWRAVYSASMDEVRKHPGTRLHDPRQAAPAVAGKAGGAVRRFQGLTEADLHYLTMGWHRLIPWPDSVAGLTRLKTKYIISPLSNGNVALLTNMAKFAGLPWDLILSAELFEHYKPDPETYLGAASLLWPAAGTGDDGRRAQPRSQGRAETRTEDRLRRAADRIRPAAEMRFRGQRRLGYRRRGFWRDRRPDGVLGQSAVTGARRWGLVDPGADGARSIEARGH